MRGWLRRLLSSELAPDLVDDAVLMTDELAANVIRHTVSEPAVVVHVEPGFVLVEVFDGSVAMPVRRRGEPGEPVGAGGWGLRVVELLSDEWGVRPLGGQGKAVWFSILVLDQAEPQR